MSPESVAAVPIVAVGASAGGSDALRDMLGQLPPTTGFAYVYIQHQEADQTDSLIDELASATAMPVAIAEPLTRISINHLYVVPPTSQLEVVNGVFITAAPQPESVFHQPIDQFFMALSRRQKEGAIAILLSGTASDGTLGLRTVKSAGGITFAQDETARFQSMPRSAIREGVVDKVLSPMAIADELQRLSQQVSLLGELTVPEEDEPVSNRADAAETELIDGSDEDMRSIIQQLRVATGVDFSQYKMTTIRRRIIRRTVLFKFESLTDYASHLRQNPDELMQLYDDLLINVTSFFRDTDTMDYVQKVMLPHLIREKAPQEPIRIWVPACSTGQEAYSLAMLLLEVLGDQTVHRQIQLFATDLSESAVAKARLGSYTRGEVMDMSPRRLQRFFTRIDDHYRINKSVRDLCVFAQHNLLKDPPFSRVDLVSCRNLLIYLNPAVQRKVIDTFHYALNSNGYLMLGRSETVGGSTRLFSQLEKNYKIFIRRNDVDSRGTFAMTPRPTDGERTTKMLPAGPWRMERNSLVGLDQIGVGVSELDRAINSVLLSQYVPASVVINQDLDILQFRGSTGLFLEPSPGRASLNLIKMARPSLALELRNITHKAQRLGESVRKSGLEIRLLDRLHYVAIEAIPLSVATNDQLILVLFTEIDPPARADTEATGIESARIRELENELANLREDMRSIIEVQEASNEELQSANEEIISSNEELQSTNEELETSKEEIESTNEELLTINQELQVRNDQLSEAYQFAEDIFGTIREATLILDTDLRIKSANPAFYRLFRLSERDIDRRLLYELDSRQWDNPTLRVQLIDVVAANMPLHSFELTYESEKTGPIQLSLNARRVVRQRDSILLAIEDVTERRRAQLLSDEQQLRQQAEERLRISDEQRLNILTLFSQAPVALAIFKGPEFVIDMANERVLEYWGRTREQVMNKPLFEALPESANQGYEELLNGVYTTRQKYVARELSVTLFRHGQLEKTYIDFVYEPYYDVTGDIVGVMVVANEITEQVVYQQQLEATVAQLRTLVENTPDALTRWNRELRLTFANPAFSTKIGQPLSELLGKTREEITELESAASSYSKTLLQVFSSGQSQERYDALPTSGGTVQFYSRMVPEFDSEGSIQSVLAIARDITELQHTTENLQAVLNSSPVAISYLKPRYDSAAAITDFQLVVCNQEFAELAGQRVDQLIGQLVSQMGRQLWQQYTVSHIQQTFEKNQLFADERQRPDGSWINITVMRYNDGVVLTGQDITQLKRAEQQQTYWLNELEKSNENLVVLGQLRQQLRQRGELLRRSSHDIRGNFGIIQGAASLLNIANSDEERSQMMAILQRNLNQATKMITELLDVARLEAGQEERYIASFDVAQLLTGLVAGAQPLADERHLTLGTEGPTELVIQGDSVKIRRIGQNLMLNALKYTQVGSVLVGWHVGPDEQHWQLVIADTGPGMDVPATTPKGEGIGLSITRQLCTLLDGQLDIDSQPGLGTRFTLTFPRTYTSAAS